MITKALWKLLHHVGCKESFKEAQGPDSEYINELYLCIPTTSSWDQYKRILGSSNLTGPLSYKGSRDPWNSGPSLRGPKWGTASTPPSLARGVFPALPASSAVNQHANKWRKSLSLFQPIFFFFFSPSLKSRDSSPAQPPWYYLNNSLPLLWMCHKIIIT